MLRLFPVVITFFVLIPLKGYSQIYDEDNPVPVSDVKAAAKALGVSEELLNLRDPFKPPLIAEKEEPKSELELYETDKFKMIGVITGPDALRAMLTAPNGKTYFVSESDKIGTKGGVVKEISPERILVHEQVMNVLGQPETSVVEISLPEED